MADFILAPNARWQGRDQTGQPCQGGKLYTYINQTTNPKATYQDYQGLQPNTNPVILDGKGEANIYWETDELYTIKLFTADDDEVYTQDNYPVVSNSIAPVPVEETVGNIVRNEQFAFWDYGTTFSPVSGSGSQNTNDYLPNDWLYNRTDTTYTVNITRQAFTVDQTEVPNNPSYFFRYAAPGAPATETNNRLYQNYKSVRTLAGKIVSVSFYAKSPTSSALLAYFNQYFGTGGAPSGDVTTLAITANLTTEWVRYTVEGLTIPNLTGKTIGTDGNDSLQFRLNFPNDIAATIDICDVQIQNSPTLSAFPFETLDAQFKELDSRITNGIFTTGDVKATFRTTADPGWLLMNDSTIGNVGSGASYPATGVKALFTLLWTNLIDTWSPMLTSAGAASTRGASAEADWNDKKRLTLSRTLGRVIGGYGTGSGLSARALGQYLGEEAHSIIANELPEHTHVNAGAAFVTNGAANNIYTAGAVGEVFNSSGVNTTTHSAANVMQPTAFMNFMIKI